MLLKDNSCNLPTPNKNPCVQLVPSLTLSRLSQCYCYIVLIVLIVASFYNDNRLQSTVILKNQPCNLLYDFWAVLQEVEAKIESFREHLKLKLADLPSPLEEQKKLIRYMHKL